MHTYYLFSYCKIVVIVFIHYINKQYFILITNRILLSGTPMQNELAEFFNMVNFCNPGVLGSSAEFRKKYEMKLCQCIYFNIRLSRGEVY